MTPLLIIITLSWLAGLTAFIGSLGARWETIPESTVKSECIHGIVAFGGGILAAAVAFALAPEAIEVLSPWLLALTFCAGGILFCGVDAWIAGRGGSLAQFMAMLLDFVPEAISLGAVFGRDRSLGYLLAIFIAAQNLPEGFNSFREIRASGATSKSALTALFLISLLGPVAAYCGYRFLQDQKIWTAAIMSFAGGGILYLVFQDIAPQAKMQRHWKPPIGAVLGFAVGMVGHQLIG